LCPVRSRAELGSLSSSSNSPAPSDPLSRLAQRGIDKSAHMRYIINNGGDCASRPWVVRQLRRLPVAPGKRPRVQLLGRKTRRRVDRGSWWLLGPFTVTPAEPRQLRPHSSTLCHTPGTERAARRQLLVPHSRHRIGPGVASAQLETGVIGPGVMAWVIAPGIMRARYARQNRRRCCTRRNDRSLVLDTTRSECSNDVRGEREATRHSRGAIPRDRCRCSKSRPSQ